MNREQVRVAVRTILTVMGRIASRTSTRSDDFMVAVLHANEEKITDAVLDLLLEDQQPPTPDKVSQALAKVGITV